MPGFGNAGGKSTAYRNTVVTFDDPLVFNLQPPVQIDRPAEAIGQTKDSKKVNVHYVNQIGWQLRSLQMDYGKLHETAAGQDGTYSTGLGLATAASGFTESNFQRDPNLSGVTWTGPSSGRKGLQKNVAAGGTFDLSLSADETAFPGPTVTGESSDVDRVLISTANHEPPDQVSFWFESPTHAIAGYGILARFYFSGPAGSDDDLVGKGQYCLTLYGDGKARLYERGLAPGTTTPVVWDEKYAFIYEPSRQLIPFKTYIVTVQSDAYQDTDGSFHGTKIAFATAGISNTSMTQALTDAAIAAVTLGDPYPNLPIYQVPKKTEEPTTVQPLRIDLRRDVRAVFHIVKATYAETGSLSDGVFSLDFVPTTDTDFTFEWYGRMPTGTTLDAKLYDADTDVELTGFLNFTDQFGGSRTYTPNDKQRFYRAKFTFTGDGDHTPTLLAWRLFRNAVRETPSTTPTVVDDSRAGNPGLPQARVSKVSIKGQDTDPQAASASLTLNDLTGQLTDLAIRDNIPVKVTTTYDSGGVNTSILFRGYTQGAVGRVPRGGSQVYPSPNWLEYEIPCVGEWRRLTDALAPRRFTFFDRAANSPWKVTDAIKALLLGVYDSTMVDVPTQAITLFSVTQQQFIVEPGDAVAPVITRLCADYLGGWLVFDENAGTSGMWRVLSQKVAPYNNLARFRMDHPGSGTLPHVDGAYGTDTVGSQTVVKTFIRRGTYRVRPERPEGNCVAVYGGASNEAAGKQGINSSAMLTQVVYNVDSYNFLNLGSGDPGYPAPSGNPDYLGYYAPIKVFDPTLSTEEAVNWVARRVFQYACHGRQIIEFDAPLILVTDSEDTLQTNPRPLRFYDAVQVWDGAAYVQFLVRECSPSYTKDGFQFAHYELVTTTAIDEFGAVPPVKDWIGQMTRMFKRTVTGHSPSSPSDRNQHRQYGVKTSDWMALPEPSIAPIQDLDNTSLTFGDFLATMDFDGLG